VAVKSELDVEISMTMKFYVSSVHIWARTSWMWVI